MLFTAYSRVREIVNLCNPSDRDGHSMTCVDFITLYIQRQCVQRDPVMEEREKAEICLCRPCTHLYTNTQSE